MIYLYSFIAFYLGWVAMDWRDIRYHFNCFIREVPYCVKTQIRHWKGKYTQKERIGMAIRDEDYPNGIQPSVPWYEVKYGFRSLLSDFLGPYYSVRRFLENLIYYMPIIWSDRWWDHTFMFQYIERKARRDAKMYLKHGHLENNDETAAELEELANLCHRIRMNEYSNDMDKAHEEKWGKMHMNFLPEPPHDPEDPGASRTYLWNPNRDKANTPELERQEKNEFMEIHFKAEDARNDDVEKFGNLFKKILNWWD